MDQATLSLPQTPIRGTGHLEYFKTVKCSRPSSGSGVWAERLANEVPNVY